MDCTCWGQGQCIKMSLRGSLRGGVIPLVPFSVLPTLAPLCTFLPCEVLDPSLSRKELLFDNVNLKEPWIQ